jgi:glyoxylase-like metal-dependent hydrolase (beta-lactamase superfamily II)
MTDASDRRLRALAAHPEDAAPLPAGIHRIAIPTPFPIGRVNTYLLEGSPLTLVDTGVNTGVGLDALEGALAVLGHRIEDIELLVLTHEHVDHLGLATVIARRAECPVAAWAPLQSLYDPDAGGGDAFHMRLAWASAQLERHGYSHELAASSRSVLMIASAFGSRPQIDVPLSEGDILRAGSRDWEILYRPGHSLSDLVLVDRSSGVAISGDHMLAGTSPNPTLTAPLEVHRPDATTERVRTLPLYLESVGQTATDGLTLMLPGHGPLLGPPAELIEERRKFHARRADKFEAMLGDEPQTVFELASQMWRGVPIAQPHLTLSEVAGHLDVLTDAGRTAEVSIGDGVVGFVSA